MGESGGFQPLIYAKISRKRQVIRPRLAWIVNRKSH